MNADLERLIALQRLDTTADTARKKLAAEPEHEQALEVRLEAARQRVAAVKEQLAANKNARAALEKDVAVQQGRLSKFRETAMAVKTNQEFTAVQHEIAFAQTEIKKIEDAILERMLESDDLAAALKTAEADLTAEQKAVDADRKAATAAHVEMEAALERIVVERAALIAGLDRQVLAMFEAVARKRNGVAMSEARGGVCTICHVRLRPQVFNTALRNDSILQCDHCNRILYHVPAPAAAATAPSDPSARPAP
jgi:predicted  nucleic acid-binding Zn-ribbon protein